MTNYTYKELSTIKVLLDEVLKSSKNKIDNDTFNQDEIKESINYLKSIIDKTESMMINE